MSDARTIRIAALAGDGIGREVVPAALAVVRAATATTGTTVSIEDLPWSADHYLATGVTIPDEEFSRLAEEADAIFLGGLGDPRVPDMRHARDILLGLRFRLDLYINLRPIRVVLPALSPLKPALAGELDLVVFRENTEGLYAGHGGVSKPGTRDEITTETMINTRLGVERIIEAAMAYADRTGRHRVCMADKANVLRSSGSLWRRTFLDVAQRYPHLDTRIEYIDALCMHLVKSPGDFDVIVTGNMFGDILTDLGAGLVGSLGLAASANLHPGRIGLFEPVHGTAPDIAGQGIANPMAAMLTAALLLRECGDAEAAARIVTAVEGAVEAGQTSPDLGGALDTESVTSAVIARLAAPPPDAAIAPIPTTNRAG